MKTIGLKLKPEIAEKQYLATTYISAREGNVFTGISDSVQKKGWGTLFKWPYPSPS